MSVAARLVPVFLALGPASAMAAPPQPLSVRFVYLVSADREVRQDFVEGIAIAASTVQAFYARELGGKTFTLNRPIVEIVKSDKPAAWFYGHDSGSAKDNWGFDNGLAEAKRLVGAAHNQDTVWVIYSDGPGNSGRGGAGVTVMPEDDLLGLVGQHPTQPDSRRWIYGLAHELGHALGLSHPPDLTKVPNAVMGSGFYTCFPDACELLPEDEAILHASRFIRDPRAPAPPAPRIDRAYGYDGGRFLRVLDGGVARWQEESRAGRRFDFDEVDDPRSAGLSVEPGDFYTLFDRSRNYVILIPRAGGESRISSDGGVSWHALYRVERARNP